MRKIINVLLLLLLVIVPVVNVNAATTKKEKVNVHVFYSDTCSYCKALHEFLDELKNDETYGKMFNVVDYEVDENDNSELYKKVAEYLEFDYNGTVPFYVIGAKTFNGYSEEYNTNIKKAIKSAYESNKYEDEVQNAIMNVEKNKGIFDFIKTNKNIITIFEIGVIVITFVILVAISLILILKK